MTLIVLAAALLAQAPSFDVASVKPNTPGNVRSLGGPQRGHFIQSGTLNSSRRAVPWT